MQKKIIILLFLFFCFMKSEAQWVMQNPKLGADYKSIYFISPDIGYLAGNGTILKTINGGNNWSQVYSTNKTIFSIYFVNDYTGYASGEEGTILKTTNGGADWSVLNSGTNYYLASIRFLNAETGYCVGQGSHILKTTNSGDTWSLKHSGSDCLYTVFFADSFTGWASGFDVLPTASIVYKTTDSGNNWVLQPTGFTGVHSSLYFINSTTGYMASNSVCGTGEVIKTTNGGSRWNRLMECLYATFKTITFVNSNTGYVVGLEGVILKTTDGGSNWLTQNSNTTNELTSVYFVNSNTGYIAGSNVLLKTINGGVIGIHKEENQLPQKFELYQNYPNPFNPSTKIRFDIPPSEGAGGRIVRLIIFDILGSEITSLVNEPLSSGVYEVEWDGSNYASGIYFYRIAIHSDKLITEEFSQTHKMILV